MSNNPQVKELLAHAESCLARGDYRNSHAACLDVLKADPSNASAFYLLGLLTTDHQNFGKALELFDRAIALAPNDPRPHAQRAKCLTAINRQEEAREEAERAAELAPADAHTLDTIGVVFARTGVHTRALAFFERAVARAPRNPGYLYNLGSAQQFAGAFDAAETTFLNVLAQASDDSPDTYKAYSSLVALRQQTVEGNHITELERLFNNTTDDPNRALHLGHALAKTYEDLGDTERSLDWLLRAKAAKRASLGYDRDANDGLFAAAAQFTPPPPPSVSRRTGVSTRNSANAPIFVVGLPRTGTTLVERILSSHPDVISAGELTAFGLALKRRANTPSNLVLDANTLEAAQTLDLAQVGHDYLEGVHTLVGDAAHSVLLPIGVR